MQISRFLMYVEEMKKNSNYGFQKEFDVIIFEIFIFKINYHTKNYYGILCRVSGVPSWTNSAMGCGKERKK